MDEHPARVSVRPGTALPGERGPRSPHAVDHARALRAVVLSGGGAKGVFESGVLHAFAQIDLFPQVLTGSSVGAVNAVAYAEVMRARREEGEEAARAALDRALQLWQRLDRERVADLDAWGWRVWALGVGGLAVGALLVWLSVSGGAGAGVAGLVGRLVTLTIGAAAVFAGGAVLRLWLRLPRLLRARVRHGLADPAERGGGGGGRGAGAQGPGGDGSDEERANPIVKHRHRLLRLAGLTPSLFARQGLERALTRVVPASRRFSEYRACGLDVRLTRTNVRTGRTEVSEHFTGADAARPGVDRGRRVLGDPRAVPAALASSAFPAAFPPVAAAEIYPEGENPQLHAKLAARAGAKQELHRVFGLQAKAQYLWLMSWLDDVDDREPALLWTGNETALWEALESHFRGERANWRRISGRTLFTLIETRGWPQLPVPGESAYTDRYFDGGVLDNTPLSTALTALRDAALRHDGDGPSPRETTHEIFVVLLAPRLRRRYLSASAAERLAGPALGLRALRLQAERRLADDVKMAEKIDRLLAEGQSAAPAPVLAPAAALAPAAVLASVVPASADAPRRPETWSEIFARERGGEPVPGTPAGPAREAAREPERFVRAVVTRIQPSWDLPWLLALDDRLGFEPEQARRFQVRGCRDALLALHARHAPEAVDGGDLPAHARAVRRLIGGSWEEEPRAGWVCGAERCSLRADCDRIAEREERAADPRTSPAAPVPRAG